MFSKSPYLNYPYVASTLSDASLKGTCYKDLFGSAVSFKLFSKQKFVVAPLFVSNVINLIKTTNWLR